jgi:hypothetical protein
VIVCTPVNTLKPVRDVCSDRGFQSGFLRGSASCRRCCREQIPFHEDNRNSDCYDNRRHVRGYLNSAAEAVSDHIFLLLSPFTSDDYANLIGRQQKKLRASLDFLDGCLQLTRPFD